MFQGASIQGLDLCVPFTTLCGNPKTVVLSSPLKFRCQGRLPRIPKVYSSVWSHSSHSFMLPFPFSFPFWLPHHPLPALPLPFPLCVLPCFLPFLASQFPCQSTTLPCVPTVHSYSLLSLLTHSSLPCVTTVHIGNNIHCTVPFLVFPSAPSLDESPSCPPSSS